MTSPHPEIETLAAERLAKDEQRTESRRTQLTLWQAWRTFWAHPSPWIIATVLVGASLARILLGTGSWWELALPAAMVLSFPLVEWGVHVVVLHWRPRPLGPLTLDPLVARKHREHHADPRDLPLVFIPWPVLCWMLPTLVAVALLVSPTLGGAATAMVSVAAVGFGYEWTHYLIHSDYRPRSRWYRSIWRNHRLHHYKNEHYWFTVTTAGTTDRIFGTNPDPATIASSPTVKNLHATETG